MAILHDGVGSIFQTESDDNLHHGKPMIARCALSPSSPRLWRAAMQLRSLTAQRGRVPTVPLKQPPDARRKTESTCGQCLTGRVLVLSA